MKQKGTSFLLRTAPEFETFLKISVPDQISGFTDKA